MLRTFLLIPILCLFAVSSFGQSELPQKLKTIQTSEARFRERYVSELEKLAQWCEQNGLESEAATTRAWQKPIGTSDEIWVGELPEEMAAPVKKAPKAPKAKKDAKGKKSKTDKNAAETPVQEWNRRFMELRTVASNHYFTQAQKSVRAGLTSYGFSCLMLALQENPDNEKARRTLGYKPVKTRWLTDFDALHLRAGDVNHEVYGWIPQKHVKRYEAGERFCNGQWISAEQDAQFHSTIENGWVVETAHFFIVTNHSLEAGVAMSRQMEKLYRVWKQLFLHFYATDQQVSALFENKTVKFAPYPKHRIMLFKSSDDYHNFCARQGQDIAWSSGVYVYNTAKGGCAYFVAGEENASTMFHEVTHQLFTESCKTNPSRGKYQNYWVIEGAATFMESLHDVNDFHVVGGFDSERMTSARIYFNNSDIYVPLQEFVRFSDSTWKAYPNVNRLYAQACGLSNFLVFYDGGKYRDAYVRILFDVYAGKDTADSLTRHTGVSFDTLDTEYKEYISREAEKVQGMYMQE